MHTASQTAAETPALVAIEAYFIPARWRAFVDEIQKNLCVDRDVAEDLCQEVVRKALVDCSKNFVTN